MKLLLGVTGSIAAYRSYDIVRNWVKEGHEVRVILTGGALKFINPDLYYYLGAKEVLKASDDFDTTKIKDHNNPVIHIELARWCDRLIIAPLSANTLSRLAHGEASCLLSSVFLALDYKPVIIFPAMNTHMLNHPMTQHNFEHLGKLENVFIHPTEKGLLACGDYGQGKLASVEVISEIAPIIPTRLTRYPKKILITTGATSSPLDPVRYLTNPSSGLTGYFLAQKFLQEGHDVTVIAGENSTNQLNFFNNFPSYKLIRVKTTQNMRDEVIKYFQASHCYISAAAMCDIEFKYRDQKIKKSSFNFSLDYQMAPDILQEVLRIKKSDQFIVGFAAETNSSPEIFMDKWKRKPVDLLIGNVVNSGVMGESQTKGFGTHQGDYHFVQKGDIVSCSGLTKQKLAEAVYEKVVTDGKNTDYL